MDTEIDIAAQIGAIRRQVRDGERDGRPTRTVVADRDFDTTVDDLWDAVTSPARIPRWFLPITGDLRLGGRYQLEGNAGGEITTCEPPRHLAVTWEFGGDTTWVEVRLSPSTTGGTHLVLEHTAHPGDHWGQFGPGAVGIGWDLTLLGLDLYVSTGEGMDPATAAAWQLSEEARAFMVGSSDAWCDAEIASGTDPGVARAAAGRTIAAYTASE